MGINASRINKQKLQIGKPMGNKLYWKTGKSEKLNKTGLVLGLMRGREIMERVAH